MKIQKSFLKYVREVKGEDYVILKGYNEVSNSALILLEDNLYRDFQRLNMSNKMGV